MSNMATTRTRPKLTAAKAQRAISAIVAIMETGTAAANQADLDRACDAIRAACEREGVPL